MGETRDFLGRGWSFPPRVDPATGRFVLTGEEENIRESIRIILATRRGERAMLPDFGCDLHQYVFDLPDPASLTLACSEITGALTRWEPRIVDVEVQPDLARMAEGVVRFDIRYTVRATNNPNNLVYPYYLYEGTGTE